MFESVCLQLIVRVSKFFFSHDAFHEAEQLALINSSVSISVDLMEESITNSLVKSLTIANLGESSLRQWSHFLSVKVARVIFVVLNPESVNDADPLFL